MLAALAASAPAPAADWRSEAPIGAGGFATQLGPIADIAFWAPNRGLLMTADGLWAYDGTGWHQLSTVCGAEHGRIAWAGPLEFWTISDQPVGGPRTEDGGNRSLCHFVGGEVVASYAVPLNTATSYLPMHAAACNGPNDCWFGGDVMKGPVNTGAFHLHWDGARLSAVPALTVRQPELADPARPVADMVSHQGTVYESVVGGASVSGENDEQPFLLHRIIDGSSSPFAPAVPTDPIDYGGRPPGDLGGMFLTSDGAQLWAVASSALTRTTGVPVNVLRMGADGWLTPVALDDPQHVLSTDTWITGAAVEPGTDSVWVGYWTPAENGTGRKFPARVARVHADGTVDDVTALPTEQDGIGRKQQAGHLACPAAGQCWLTTQIGWLFHLGGDLPRDDTPAMHRLITFRPLDASIPQEDPDALPDDDSGDELPVIDQSPPSQEPFEPNQPPAKKGKALVKVLSHRVKGRTTLVLKIQLAARARVQVLAKRGRRTVARTKRRTLRTGVHTLSLKLDARRWPTKIDLRADAVDRSATISAKGPAR